MYSLKAGRRLTLYGRRALDEWVALEANACVTQLCERPLVIRDTTPHRVVDFWAAGPGFSRLILLVTESEASSEKRSRSLTAFRLWADAAGCSVEERRAEPDSRARKLWLSNWIQIIQHLTSYQPYLQPELMQRIEEHACEASPIGKVLGTLADADGEMVRAGIYNLVYRGSHCLQGLDKEILGDHLCVEPVR